MYNCFIQFVIKVKCFKIFFSFFLCVSKVYLFEKLKYNIFLLYESVFKEFLYCLIVIDNYVGFIFYVKLNVIYMDMI